MRAGLLAAVAVAAIALNGPAFAQGDAQAATAAAVPAGPPRTLRDALVKTYASNPTLMAQRQTLRQADETVAIARAAGRPQISTTADFNRDVVTRNLGAGGRDLTVTGRASVPLYAGGTIRNSIRAANTRVEAGRANLRATEGDIFTEAVAAYMDVIRDRSIVQLNRNQVRVLGTNLQATRDRFEVGDLTRTDVAQSDARAALARSTLALAEGRLEASEENFRRVIGEEPGDLQPPNPLPTLPGTPDQATGIALGNNADLASIAAQARAAGYDVRVAQGDRLPTISAVTSTVHRDALGTANNGVAPGTFADSTTSTGVGLSLSWPLYQGGGAGARVRRARAFENELLERAVGVERLVISNTRSAFATYQAAVEAIESNSIAVAANQLALEGTRAEQTVGTRNVLDVLNAEQELLISQVLLVTARRDAYVAGFQLLNAMGQAEAEDLNLDGGPLYDPQVNYNRYSRSWSDWNDGPRPVPVSTRTAPPGSNSPVTQPPQ
ncbi:MAG TPA: TolC family outer membrane protein [Allosphingosinicella sp.]|nr:TolC family outer membrane protein [Allosphingosinicella sp.]